MKEQNELEFNINYHYAHTNCNTMMLAFMHRFQKTAVFWTC